MVSVSAVRTAHRDALGIQTELGPMVEVAIESNRKWKEAELPSER